MAPIPNHPIVADTQITFPHPHILLVTLNRPKKMNAITYDIAQSLSSLWNWYDANPDLRCAIITGSGTKAFCAGSDLLAIERGQKLKEQGAKGDQLWKYEMPPTGFAGMSNRRGKKPIVAAVNGLALGGGFEIVLNWCVNLPSRFLSITLGVAECSWQPASKAI